jgi:hypothetical protein
LENVRNPKKLVTKFMKHQTIHRSISLAFINGSKSRKRALLLARPPDNLLKAKRLDGNIFDSHIASRSSLLDPKSNITDRQ